MGSSDSAVKHQASRNVNTGQSGILDKSDPILRDATIELSDRLTMVALWLLLVGAVIFEIQGQSSLISLGFYTFHVIDPAPVVALAAIVTNLAARRPDWPVYTLPIVLILGLTIVDLLRGLAIQPDLAAQWARANIAIGLFLMLAVTMRPIPAVMRAMRLALLVAATTLSVLAVLRLAIRLDLFLTVEGPNLMVIYDHRPLTGQGAFLITFAGLLLFSEALHRRRFVFDARMLGAILFVAVVLISRQGTASIALLAGLATIFYLQRDSTHQLRIGFGIALLLIVAALLLVFLPSLLDTQNFASRAGNLDMRRQIWSSLMALWPYEPALVRYFGFPAGQQPVLTVFVDGIYQTWPYSMHSMYYGSLSTMGYLGAAAYIALLAMLGFRLLIATLKGTMPAFALGCWVATIVFSYSYEIRMSELLGLFAAIWWLRATASPQHASHHAHPGSEPRYPSDMAAR